MNALTNLIHLCGIAATLLPVSSSLGFLPPYELPMRFVGKHWSEDAGDKVITATATLHELGKGDFGTAMELRITTSSPSLNIEPMQWVLTPEGALYDVWFGEENADLKKWMSGTSKPDFSLADVRIPARDAESDELKKPTDVSVTSSEESWLYTMGLTSISIRLTPNRDVVRYASLHEGNSNFSTFVSQKDIGLLRIARGSGAHRDVWELDRVFVPAEKVAATADVSQLFAALPIEAMPNLGSLAMLVSPDARKKLLQQPTTPPQGVRDVRVDLKNGYLSISSATDGEGDVLESALWKRKNGARLLAVHVKHWTAGPEATSDVRLFEFKNGEFRVATFADLPLPEPKDFFSKPDEQNNTGPFIAGDWKLPQGGTAIVIRPELEDDEDMLDGVKCAADQAIELRWNGTKFSRITIPRAKKLD